MDVVTMEQEFLTRTVSFALAKVFLSQRKEELLCKNTKMYC